MDGHTNVLGDEQGAVLVMVLLVMVATLLLGVFVLQSSGIDVSIAGNERVYKEGFYEMEAALGTTISETSRWAGNEASYALEGDAVSVTIRPTGVRRPPVGSGWSVTALEAHFYTVDLAPGDDQNTEISAGVWKVAPRIKK